MIEEVFVFVQEKYGDEDVVVIDTTAGAIPLITRGEKTKDMMKERAREIARKTKVPVKVLRFSSREELETLES